MFDYDTIFALVENDVALAAYYGGQGKTDAYSAKTYYDLGNESAALQLVIAAAIHYGDAFSQFFNAASVPYPWYRLMALFDALHQDDEAPEPPPEYELTLVKFIAAYIDAEDDHRSAHRLLLDAYQASMYDKPFDLEYHKTWIRRFLSWR